MGGPQCRPQKGFGFRVEGLGLLGGSVVLNK